MIGLPVLVVWMLGAVVMARRRGFSFGRIGISFIGFIVGGALGAAPGAFFLFPALSANSAEPFDFYLVGPAALFLFGAAIGSLAGPPLLDRIVFDARSTAAAWAMACAGFMTGVVVSVLALIFMRQESWPGKYWVILAPLSIAASTVAGYSHRAAQL